MKRPSTNEIEDEIYERQARLCKAFGNATRLRILDLLGNGEKKASYLQHRLGITTANLSQHLAVLKAAAVVTTSRHGKQVHCSLTIPEVKQACGLIRRVLRAQIRNDRKLSGRA